MIPAGDPETGEPAVDLEERDRAIVDASRPAGIEREAEHPDPRRIAMRDPLDPVLALPSDRERVLRTSPRIVRVLRHGVRKAHRGGIERRESRGRRRGVRDHRRAQQRDIPAHRR